MYKRQGHEYTHTIIYYFIDKYIRSDYLDEADLVSSARSIEARCEREKIYNKEQIQSTGCLLYTSMVLAMVAIAIFIPTGNAIRFAGIVIVADVAAVILAYMRPLESEKLSKEVVLQSTLCSLLIVLLCVFLISILLQMQRQRQEEEVKKLNEQLKDAADKDALTGLYNRRYLNQYLGELILDEKEEFDAVLIDLDFFKHVRCV